MTQLEQQLFEALLNLDGAVRRLAQERPNVNLLPLFARIDELAAQLPPGTHPQLLHFLQQKSHEKALLWLQGDGAQIPRGSCGR
jgi:hypothetical protein